MKSRPPPGNPRTVCKLRPRAGRTVPDSALHRKEHTHGLDARESRAVLCGVRDGKGWAGCRQYCHQGATFSAQAGALAGVATLERYAKWMKGLLTPMPDGSYEVRSFAEDEERKNVAAYGVFRGTHTERVGRCRRPGSAWRRTTST